jgi:hypothetical protein
VEILVVADTRDTFAAQFATKAATAVDHVELWDHVTAAQRFSLHRAGRAVSVRPLRPMLLRQPRWEVTDTERRFHQAERFSLIWAAGALSAAPVVNRPDPHGLCGRVDRSTAVLAARTNTPVGAGEVYLSRARNVSQIETEPCEGDIHREWWLEDLRTGMSVREAGFREQKGLFRATLSCAGTVTGSVTVVGKAAFPGPIQPPADAVQRSVNIANRLGLAFATVRWRWRRGHTDPTLAGVSSHPVMPDLAHCLDDVVDALLHALRP